MIHNLKREAGGLTEHWHPKIVAQVNDQYVKVAKVLGSLTWHSHAEEDELFLVLKGTLNIEYEDHTVTLAAGDCHVVPKGVLHNPVCDEECLIALIETITTQHTGDVVTNQTVAVEDQLS